MLNASAGEPPLARWSPLVVRAFEALVRPWMRRRLRAVRMAGLPWTLAPDEPLVLVANHVSWWDGFLLRALQLRLRPAAPLYTVMLESRLAQMPVFRLMGAVGITPGEPVSLGRVLRFLRERRRREPGLVVAFFPQGRMWPAYRRPLGFRRGLASIVRALAPATLLPVGLHLEPTNAPALDALISVGRAVPHTRDVEVARLETAVEIELDLIHDFLCAHGERAADEWPPECVPLPGDHGPEPADGSSSSDEWLHA